MKKKYGTYFIESVVLTILTMFLWLEKLDGTSYSMGDSRYIGTLIFINFCFIFIHEELMKISNAEKSLKKTLKEYIKFVVSVGVMYFIQLIIFKLIMPIGNFGTDIPLLYVFTLYILYVIATFKYTDKEKKAKKKIQKVFIVVLYIMLSILVYYVLAHLLLAPIQVIIIVFLTILAAVTTTKTIITWRKQEKIEA